jgi:hypothetical protein
MISRDTKTDAVSHGAGFRSLPMLNYALAELHMFVAMSDAWEVETGLVRPRSCITSAVPAVEGDWRDPDYAACHCCRLALRRGALFQPKKSKVTGEDKEQKHGLRGVLVEARHHDSPSQGTDQARWQLGWSCQVLRS